MKQAESEQIVAALEKAGIEHDYMLFPDEGHGFAKPENRLRFFAAADKFLSRYLGGAGRRSVTGGRLARSRGQSPPRSPRGSRPGMPPIRSLAPIGASRAASRAAMPCR